MADRNFQFITPGISSVGNYQLSGVPYASSSIDVVKCKKHGSYEAGGFSKDVVNLRCQNAPERVQFPGVTKFITVKNEASGSTDAPIRVGFSKFGVGGESQLETLAGNVPSYFFVLQNGESYTADWRIEELYIIGHPQGTADLGSTASVIAGITRIGTGSIPGISASTSTTAYAPAKVPNANFQNSNLTGINWSGSLGVG